MSIFTLSAERDCHDPIPLGEGSLDDLAALIERLEDEGRWPEGHDAVARGAAGTFLYADCWEPLASPLE